MDVVHPQIHLSRTSPPGAQSQGTTAQIGFLPIHGPKIQVQRQNLQIRADSPIIWSATHAERNETVEGSFK